MGARRGRRRAISPPVSPPPDIAIECARDPETFNFDDLATELKVQAEDARARLKIVDARMQQYGTERENLYRYLSGVENALGLNNNVAATPQNSSRF